MNNAATRPARIAIHTSATTARKPFASPGGRAYIYVGGQLVTQARAANDAEAVKQAVRSFRMARADRKAG